MYPMNYFKKFNKQQSGFTLIELLIVVAIIAILSGVVLASLNSARAKAKEEKQKSELSSIRAQAELYYGANSYSYGVANTCATGMFADATSNGLKKLIDSVTAESGAGNVQCFSTANQWAVGAKVGAVNWCVDSNGNSKAATPTADICP